MPREGKDESQMPSGTVHSKSGDPASNSLILSSDTTKRWLLDQRLVLCPGYDSTGMSANEWPSLVS